MPGDAPIAAGGQHDDAAAHRSPGDALSSRAWERDDDPSLRLLGPEPARRDPGLGEEVNNRLIAWAERIGIYPGELERFAKFGIGHLAALAYPDTDSVDRLSAAARCLAASAAVDDHDVTGGPHGGTVERALRQLTLVQASLQPVALPARYAADWRRTMRDDAVLRAVRSAMRHIWKRMTVSQAMRLRGDVLDLLLAKTTRTRWLVERTAPSVEMYLMHRQFNSFVPWMGLTDVVGGYEVPTAAYGDPHVRQAIMFASSASTVVNDLYSMEKEKTASGMSCNLPTLIAAEDMCSPDEAVRRTIAIHNEFIHAFDAVAVDLDASPEPALRRFVNGLRSWMSGNRTWHATSHRYRAAHVY